MSDFPNVLLGDDKHQNIGVPNADIWLYSYEQLPVIVLDGADFFAGNCVLAIEGDEFDNSAFPVGSYSTTFGYCRTAIKIAMDDYDPSDLFGSIRALAPLVVIRLRLTECGNQILAAQVQVVSAGLASCGVAGFISTVSGYGYVVIDTLITLLPIKLEVTVRSKSGLARTGFIQVLGA